MKLQVLISTMNQVDTSLVKKLKIKSDCIILNQCDNDKRTNLLNEKFNIQMINSTTRGLSKSRNLLIKSSSSEICLIGDDDLEYVDGYENIIKSKFEEFPSADIIVFQVEGIEEKFKDYPKKEKKLNFITSMKVSSVEIAFKLDSIRKNNIKFNEEFGSGARYSMGEENIFLFECIRKGLKIQYVPVKIADLHIGNSTWFKGFNEKFFIDRGASFYAMSSILSFLLIVQYTIRKYSLYKNDIGFISAYKNMIIGAKQYKKTLKNILKE